MGKSKKYEVSYDDYEDGKNSSTLITEILEDKELPELEEIIIGSWGGCWEESSQAFIDEMINKADKFSHIKSLFIGDMDYEECEVSWIIQGNYEKLFKALPNLKALTIKGSTDLILGKIVHNELEELTIICGGLPEHIIGSIESATLPNLRKLNLYIGVEDYGFSGNIDTIKNLLEKSDFPKLTYLGINNSQIQDEITECILNSKYISQITTLDLSNGTLTDKGGKLLLEALPNYPNIKNLDLHYHYLSDKMMKNFSELEIDVDLDEQNEPDQYDGDDEIYYYPMLTE